MQYYSRELCVKPSKLHKDTRSWTAQIDVLLAICNYQPPTKYIEPTRQQRANESFERELEGNGNWLRQPRQWSMENIVETYDDFLRDSPKYLQMLNVYFAERPDRRAEYLQAGGTLVK